MIAPVTEDTTPQPFDYEQVARRAAKRLHGRELRPKLDIDDVVQEVLLFVCEHWDRSIALEKPDPDGLHGTSKAPSPPQAAIVEETWRALRDGCRPHELYILELRLAGYTYQQIADEIGMDKSSIYRLFRRMTPTTPTKSTSVRSVVAEWLGVIGEEVPG